LEANERGTGIPLPAGLVIPTLDSHGRVIALKVRRRDYQPGDRFPKYQAVPGNCNAPMILAAMLGKSVVVVESELDALLLAQEAHDLACAVALRTATGKPDRRAHALLKAAPVILVALDNDQAGHGAWPWWKQHYRQAIRWRVPQPHKDVGDYMVAGGDLRIWLQAGLEAPRTPPGRAKDPEPTRAMPRPATTPPTACPEYPGGCLRGCEHANLGSLDRWCRKPETTA
jgi:hypothetical protein